MQLVHFTDERPDDNNAYDLIHRSTKYIRNIDIIINHD